MQKDVELPSLPEYCINRVTDFLIFEISHI